MLVVVVRGVLCHTLHLSCSWGQAIHLEQASLYNASKIHYKTGSKEHDRRAKSFARHISASYSLNVHNFHTDCFVTECSALGSIIMCYSLMNKWCCHFRDLLLNWLVSNPNINDTLFFFPPHCDRCLSSLPPLFCWRNRVHLEEKPASKRQETQGYRCYHSDGERHVSCHSTPSHKGLKPDGCECNVLPKWSKDKHWAIVFEDEINRVMVDQRKSMYKLNVIESHFNMPFRMLTCSVSCLIHPSLYHTLTGELFNHFHSTSS